MSPYWNEYDTEDWEDEPYENVREAFAPHYQDLPPQAVETILATQGLSADEMEFSLSKALGRAGKFIKSAAPSVLPVAGTVLGTAFGGPVGAALGGTLGKVAGGAIGGIGGGSKGVARGALGGLAGGLGGAQRAIAGRAGAVGSPAAAQLLQVLNRPELLQGLLSMALGPAGRRQIPVGRQPVPAASFANLIGQLANQAAAEYHEMIGHEGEGVPSYLLDDSGEFVVDPAVPEQRAARLLEVLNEAALAEATWDEWAEDDEAEADYDDIDAAYDELELAAEWDD